MKFFKPEDFFENSHCDKCAEWAATESNNKLEREGKVVYTNIPDIAMMTHWSYSSLGNKTHIGLLINIEPIEKCTHPAEKIKILEIHAFGTGELFDTEFICECGVKVKPITFEEEK